MTATLRRRTGWNGLHLFRDFWALVPVGCEPTRHPLRRARRSDRAAYRRNHSAGPPMIRSEDPRTSTWVFVEHLRPRHGLLYGRRPEDDLRPTNIRWPGPDSTRSFSRTALGGKSRV